MASPSSADAFCSRLVLASFFPWIPPGSDPRFRGVRLLIMGESHYDKGKQFSDDEKREHTRQVVRDWAANSTGYQKFFVNIYRTLSDDGADWSSPQLDRALEAQ